MDMSNHTRLYAERLKAATVAPEGLVRAIMLPFEILHRHNWSAPWDCERGAR